MRSKVLFSSILIIFISQLLLAKPVNAGGWVVITLDALPGPVQAGESIQLGFMVRQHGMMPINSVSPRLTAVNRETGDSITLGAEQVGETGHFQVVVVFPDSGVWDWQISAAPFPQPVQLDSLKVLPAGSIDTVTTLTSVGAVGYTRAASRWTGIGLLCVAAVLAFMGQQSRRKSAVAPGSAA